MKRLKLSVAEKIAIGLSLISLAVSFRSCRQSDRALEFTQADFEGGRALFWSGNVDGSNVLHLKFSNPEAVIQFVYVVFPQEFEMGDIHLDLDAPTIPLTRIREKLTAKMNENLSTVAANPSNSVADVHLPMLIPFSIDTSYIVKGEIRRRKALYSLLVTTTFTLTRITETGGYVYQIVFHTVTYGYALDNIRGNDAVENSWNGRK